MRICYVLLSPTFGMHQYTADLANRMVQFGYDVHLVTTARYPGHRYLPTIRALGEASISPLLVRCSLVLLPLFAIGYGMSVDIDAILHEGNKSAQQMADYLDAYVASEALVETWEWEISFLSQGRFHHPPFYVLDALTRRDQLGVAPEGELYSPELFRPNYLVDGPWSYWAHVYDEYIEQHCVLETAVGPYSLNACAQ